MYVEKTDWPELFEANRKAIFLREQLELLGADPYEAEQR